MRKTDEGNVLHIAGVTTSQTPFILFPYHISSLFQNLCFVCESEEFYDKKCHGFNTAFRNDSP